ncbi:kinesin-4 [Carex littledalei]|uniref:Kinesin-4 n=1 Tax=Carex littledalei TaxID=544730 RepID=A0A833R405_9POAL|nr:kinesin-4 [Carex littledalei]
MEPKRISFRQGCLSRKAEETALRRYEAAAWLESIAGPLCLPQKPSDHEFVSCLRNGLVLCNAINKIQPGSVPKVVSNALMGSPASDNQNPLPAYQYFENIRNFLVAVEELKLPTFEASDLEREKLDTASVSRLVDCILSLKSYHEWKRGAEINGSLKSIKSPLFKLSLTRAQIHMTPSGSFVQRSRLNLTSDTESKPCKAKDEVVRIICQCLVDAKENINQVLATNVTSQEREFKSAVHCSSKEGKVSNDISPLQNKDHYTSDKDRSDHMNFLEAQEQEIRELRLMLEGVKSEYRALHNQVQNDYATLVHEIQGLSTAASRYNEAVKENRNLYNMLQELRGNIRVFCRIRPTFNSTSRSSIEYIGEDGSVMVFDPLKPQSTRKVFQFNKVFGPKATQGDVYKETQSLIRSVVDGYNVCIFAYGQTGSGKTHTMCGPSGGSAKDNGINYMALNDLFSISSTRENVKYQINVQMVEIYNEQVRDLLCTLEIRTCTGNGQTSLPDAKMLPVGSTEDVINVMKLGEINRASSSTAMNDRSSRSHSILIVHVHGEEDSGEATHSCLYLVDLAGSERVDRSEATGDRLKEAQHINKSLSCLGDVITALAQKNSHIPYRNSKLTQLLQKSLGGNAKTLMFAHISPEIDSYAETISTLKFAQRVSTVELGAACANKESNEMRDLKNQIDNLKKALAIKETERVPFSSKMKENVPTMESSSKQAAERTPPRSRRFSLETPTYTKIPGAPTKTSQSQFGFHAQEKSPDKMKCDVAINGQDDFTFSSTSSSEQKSVRASVAINGQDDFSYSSTSRSVQKSVRASVVSKGSNIRKSIQSLGKLINASEKRSNQCPIEKPVSKIRSNLDSKSPVNSKTDSRTMRRQSLTNPLLASSNFSRRSSLGGKSDTNLSDVSKTPPSIKTSSKATKKWL